MKYPSKVRGNVFALVQFFIPILFPVTLGHLIYKDVGSLAWICLKKGEAQDVSPPLLLQLITTVSLHRV